jgi:putative RNA 2'-phosphotransferase
MKEKQKYQTTCQGSRRHLAEQRQCSEVFTSPMHIGTDDNDATMENASMMPNEIKKLEKFLLYVLSRRPDEFGLLPDDSGFIKIKALLQALHEEPGWKHIRQAHINSVLLMKQPSSLEINENENCIRASQRDQMPALSVPDALPKLLYTPVRRRAHQSIHGNGIRPSGLPYILLSSDISMAERLGQRIDNEPVLLIVQTAMATGAGTLFRQFGELIYLADFIAPGTFSGPPLPKEPPEAPSSRLKQEPQRNETPGSYFPDLSSNPLTQPSKQQRHRRNDADWKKQRRLARKEKERQQRQ